MPIGDGTLQMYCLGDGQGWRHCRMSYLGYLGRTTSEDIRMCGLGQKLGACFAISFHSLTDKHDATHI